ncbi:MAG: glycoside hydrolase family 13 protein [Oscillospiraceae bacterium]|nr:glycoside hydrolase family 13 protein [Oscillospiraceae bacterium]
MRILFDSKQLQFKDPFGTLIPDQTCTLHIHIPSTVQTTKVECVINHEHGALAQTVALTFKKKQGPYDIFSGNFCFEECGLFFYYFRITTKTGCFKLFKYGDETNMEAGDCWQVSCVPADFTTPDWAKGALIYQIFPDRFHKVGKCDLTGKLEPYTVHRSWHEEVDWRPTKEGLVLNNDFYGGNFKGITEKMDYIASLGVTIIYLNPISKSFSSHRYDTGDYKTPDPMLGTEAEFTAMCEAAHKRGIKVVLDGVYSHTGADSLYFDRNKTFGGKGAYNSKSSPYYNWYTFHNWPNTYNSWWGFDTLPTVNKMNPDFIEYIITGEDSVVAHWLKAGADGFRLDVVDELPDAFIDLLKKRIREIRPDALLIGEVWEDASNKHSYGVRRRYFVDGILDSAMNYPFRNAIINFIRGWDNGPGLKNTVMSIAENYPPQVFLCNMNLLGTHDTPRILTALVDIFEGSREEQSKRFLSRSQYVQAQERLVMASFLQYTLPGSPSLYYADEAGMEGHKDPFNRRTYPWGREDQELLSHFKRLGQLRKENEALRLGDIQFFKADDRKIGFTRTYGEQKLRIYLNRGGDLWEIAPGKILLGHNIHTLSREGITLDAKGFCVVEEK